MHSFSRIISLETIDLVNERVKLLLSHGEKRSIILTQRYVHAVTEPRQMVFDQEITPNLYLDTDIPETIVVVKSETHADFTAYLNHCRAISYGTRHTTNARANHAWEKRGIPGSFNSVTRVSVEGWGTEPATDDSIVIEHWNEHGVLRITTVNFSWYKNW